MTAPKQLPNYDVTTAPLSASDHRVVVKGGAVQLEPAINAPRIVNTNPYTAVLSDERGWLRHVDPDSENNQAIFQIPANADVAFPIGAEMTIEAKGKSVAIVGLSGVTVNPSNPCYLLFKNSVCVAKKVDTNEWTVAGAYAPNQ